MAKKTTARPYVEQLTTNLKSPDGKSRTVTLGPKTIIVGPNGSGKSSIQQSLQLALVGSADDLFGRMGVRDSGLLMSMVSDDRLAVNAKLNTGSDYTFLAKDGGRPVHDSGTTASLPLHQVREVLEGSPATARKAFLGWAASDVTANDVADQVPAIYRAKYRDISDAMGRGKTPVDALLTVIEYVGKRQRDASKEATGAETLLTSMTDDLEPCPTEEQVKAALAFSNDVHAKVMQATNLTNTHAMLTRRVQDLQAQLAAPEVVQVDPTERDFYKGMAFASTVAVDRGLTACPLCSSNVGAGHLVACRNFYTQAAKEFAASAGPMINRPYLKEQLRTALAELESLQLPTDDTSRDAADAAQNKYLELRNLADRWANLTRARDTAAEMSRESETYKGMKKELEMVVGGLLKRVAGGFCERVQAYLPKDWTFKMQLEENGKEVFRLGLMRDGKLRAALSGAEWATVTCAIAMVITTSLKPEQPVLVMPEDRGWDAVTLGKILNSWSSFDGQVVIGTTTKPKKVPTGWTLIELSVKAEVEVEATPVVEEAKPSPLSATMVTMLKTLGYPEAMVQNLTAEQAIDIVQNNRVFLGGE
jgi:hypothetical protein